MKKIDLLTADFAKAADALTDEAFNGGIHLDICKGLSEMDPIIGNDAPVFFMYTFYGHLYCAQMYANKLFDTDADAVTVPRFLEMARIRAGSFEFAEEKDVVALIAEAKIEIEKLNPTVRILRRRRNDFLAHISKKLAFNKEALRNAEKLQFGQISDVLYSGGRIVNSLLQMWNNSRNQLRETHSDDYLKVIERMTKHLCAEIKAHEAEFAKHGLTPRLARPRGCE